MPLRLGVAEALAWIEVAPGPVGSDAGPGADGGDGGGATDAGPSTDSGTAGDGALSLQALGSERVSWQVELGGWGVRGGAEKWCGRPKRQATTPALNTAHFPNLLSHTPSLLPPALTATQCRTWTSFGG